ncbi:hypothetical protein IT414_02465 [bacterium]|nr:hypothetical protein [bacterium]
MAQPLDRDAIRPKVRRMFQPLLTRATDEVLDWIDATSAITDPTLSEEQQADVRRKAAQLSAQLRERYGLTADDLFELLDAIEQTDPTPDEAGSRSRHPTGQLAKKGSRAA